MKMIEEHGYETITEEEIDNDEPKDNLAYFIESNKGKTFLQYGDFRYKRAYNTKNGTRWNCSMKRGCPAFLYVNDNEEIIMSNPEHVHESDDAAVDDSILELRDSAIVITSRKGKEMLLFRKYTYRKQYEKGERSRWVCSTQKNCHAWVFTDSNNMITSASEDHCHDPPKYYLKPSHLLGALRQPIVLETD